MLPQRFFRLFADKERRRPANKKTRFVCETLEPRLALASVSNADPSVVLIDASLMVDIPRQELAGSRVIAIDSRRDAIDQISTALAGLSEIDVVRVISHGSDGSLWFGDQRIDATTLATRADEIAGWGRSLSAGADMLLYGCSVASAGDGSQFVRALAGLTGADTAANSNHTGLTGDVTLDFQVGDVTHGGAHVERRPQELGDGLGLGRRLDDDEGLGHCVYRYGIAAVVLAVRLSRRFLIPPASEAEAAGEAEAGGDVPAEKPLR
jgi:hypothetical protein